MSGRWRPMTVPARPSRPDGPTAMRGRGGQAGGWGNGCSPLRAVDAEDCSLRHLGQQACRGRELRGFGSRERSGARREKPRHLNPPDTRQRSQGTSESERTRDLHRFRRRTRPRAEPCAQPTIAAVGQFAARDDRRSTSCFRAVRIAHSHDCGEQGCDIVDGLVHTGHEVSDSICAVRFATATYSCDSVARRRHGGRKRPSASRGAGRQPRRVVTCVQLPASSGTLGGVLQ